MTIFTVEGCYVAGGRPGPPAPTLPVDDAYIGSLVAQSTARLTKADYQAAADQLGCELNGIMAVAKVESRGVGFGGDRRPTILFEPHRFSALTNRQFDTTPPNSISYPKERTLPYPDSHVEKWNRFRWAYAKNQEMAVQSTSWGVFQTMGENYAWSGFANAKAFTADLAKSEKRQLSAFVDFVLNKKGDGGKRCIDFLLLCDWTGFARAYNGKKQKGYDKLIELAYLRLSHEP